MKNTELETLRRETENLTEAYTNAILNGGIEYAEPIKKLLEEAYARFQKALNENK